MSTCPFCFKDSTLWPCARVSDQCLFDQIKWSLLRRWTGQFCRFTSAQKKSLSTKNRSRFESVLLKGVGVAYLGDRCFPTYGRVTWVRFPSYYTQQMLFVERSESGAQGNETVITYGQRSDSSFRHLASFKGLMGIKCCK